MFITYRKSVNAFTLIELSIVVLVLALLAGAVLRYANSTGDATALSITNATLDTVDAALQNYRNIYGRLPCPADLTTYENTSVSPTFGTEVGTPGDGNCTGYNYINSSLDPDSLDPNYDSATLNQVVEGAVPTKTLKLDDKYAYDAWGNKIFYAVDIRLTKALAFSVYPVTAKIGAVVVKKTSGDTLANALSGTLVNGISYNAVYTTLSTGKNGHGSYPRNLSATIISRFNAGSTNSDELANCHCTSAAAATAFNRIFIQKSKTNDPTSYTNNFDDIVRFKTRANLAGTAELQ